MRALILAGLLLAAPVMAQAPAEERKLSADAIEASQQRITTLRRELQSAEDNVKQAEEEQRSAQATLADARSRAAAAARNLKAARDKQARVRQAYRQESAAFDALRQGGTAPAARTAAATSGKP